MEHGLLKKAIEWVDKPSGDGFLSDREYCPTRDIFQARLDKFRIQLEQNGFIDAPLLVAVAGEIGNNSFDHNVGSWRDIAGVYFDVDYNGHAIIISDRGQGIKTTILRVKREIQSDREAIQVAFTEKISGRSPEQRGNGLKFVKKVVEDKNWHIELLSGQGSAKTNEKGKVDFYDTEHTVFGCITLVKF